jgi:hypothetical protein
MSHENRSLSLYALPELPFIPFTNSFPFIRTALSSHGDRYIPKPYSPLSYSSTSYHSHPNSKLYEDMSLPASLADSKVDPPTIEGENTVKPDDTIPPSDASRVRRSPFTEEGGSAAKPARTSGM